MRKTINLMSRRALAALFALLLALPLLGGSRPGPLPPGLCWRTAPMRS